MSHSAPPQELDYEALNRAKEIHRNLSEKLSIDSLGSLAREVLVRVSSRLVAESSLLGSPSESDLEAFCDVLISESDSAAANLILQARADGVPLDSIYLGYLAGASRKLGERWDDDQCSFLDITVATGRIYAIMRGLRRLLTPPVANTRRHAFFAPLPGDNHTLGVTMAADLFRQKGWDIDLAIHNANDDLIDALNHSDHAIVGISASRPELAEELAKLVVAIRICKPHCFVMVSGHITEMEPDVMSLVDADAFATSAPGAIAQLEQRIADQLTFNTG